MLCKGHHPIKVVGEVGKVEVCDEGGIVESSGSACSAPKCPRKVEVDKLHWRGCQNEGVCRVLTPYHMWENWLTGKRREKKAEVCVSELPPGLPTLGW